MNPDVNKIFNKFSEEKTKLSIQKVELGKIDDLLDIQQEIEAYLGSAIKDARDVEALFRKVRDRNETKAKNAEKLRNKALGLVSDISDAYKTLGEKMPAKVSNTYDKIFKDVGKIPTSNIGNIFPI